MFRRGKALEFFELFRKVRSVVKTTLIHYFRHRKGGFVQQFGSLSNSEFVDELYEGFVRHSFKEPTKGICCQA